MAKTHTRKIMCTHTYTHIHTHTHWSCGPPQPFLLFFFSFPQFICHRYFIYMSQSQHQHCQVDFSLMIKARPLLTNDMCIDVTCFVELFHSFQFEFWWLWLYDVSQSSARLHRFWSQKFNWFNTTVCVFLGISSVIESLILVRCRLLFPSFCIIILGLYFS